MLIDWFTVVAQIVNFLILVWLLRRLLYGPVLRAMQAREARIAAQSAEALAAKQVAEQEAAELRRLQAQLEESRDQVLAAARQEAEERRKELVAQARRELDEARAGWYRGLQAEREAFLRELRRRLGSQLCAISRQALADLADAELEARAVALFVRRLAALEADERARLVASARKGTRPIFVRSAFPLDDAARRALEDALFAGLDKPNKLTYEQDPALLCGVEISTQDHKIAWTMADYLAALERDILEHLEGEIENGRRNGALLPAPALRVETTTPEQSHAG